MPPRLAFLAVALFIVEFFDAPTIASKREMVERQITEHLQQRRRKSEILGISAGNF